MDCKGFIFDVNQAFTNNFGYSTNDIKGQNFNILLNEFDRKKKLPELELETVTATGQAQDENYVVNKEGLEVWALGESL